MPRPAKCRHVEALPEVNYFKPRGVPMSLLEEVSLTLEGFEALRLAELEELGQEEAAERMNVSRQTFGRVLAQARKAVARAVVKGWALKIHGGNYLVKGAGAQTCHGFGPARQGKSSGTGPFTEEDKMSKIAVSAQGPGLDEPIDPRFGRAAGFMIVDPKTMDFEYVDNGSSQVLAQGAGLQAAEIVSRAGAELVLTGFVGPKAFQALAAAGIKVGQDLDGLSVREAVERFQAGGVEAAGGPNKGGHWR